MAGPIGGAMGGGGLLSRGGGYMTGAPGGGGDIMALEERVRTLRSKLTQAMIQAATDPQRFQPQVQAIQQALAMAEEELNAAREQRGRLRMGTHGETQEEKTARIRGVGGCGGGGP